MTTTEQFCAFNCHGYMYDAIQANANFLTLAPNQFHALLKNMDYALHSNNIYKVQSIRKELLELYSSQEIQ